MSSQARRARARLPPLRRHHGHQPEGLSGSAAAPTRPARRKGRGAWWQMPQGGIDAGEDPAAAALRELFEETGIRSGRNPRRNSGLAALRPAAASHRQGLGRPLPRPEAEVVRGALPRATTARSTSPPPTGHKAEFTAWRWVPLAEVADLIVPFKRDVYRAGDRGLCAATHGRRVHRSSLAGDADLCEITT